MADEQDELTRLLSEAWVAGFIAGRDHTLAVEYRRGFHPPEAPINPYRQPDGK